jgi:hypothetical protein
MVLRLAQSTASSPCSIAALETKQVHSSIEKAYAMGTFLLVHVQHVKAVDGETHLKIHADSG